MGMLTRTPAQALSSLIDHDERLTELDDLLNRCTGIGKRMKSFVEDSRSAGCLVTDEAMDMAEAFGKIAHGISEQAQSEKTKRTQEIFDAWLAEQQKDVTASREASESMSPEKSE